MTARAVPRSRVCLLAVELEHGFAFEKQVQLLLAAHAFVVFFDKRLIGSVRDEEVDPESVDTERMLEWVPDGIVRPAVADRRHGGGPAHRPRCHPRSLGAIGDRAASASLVNTGPTHAPVA